MELTGKVAFITGAARGQGRSHALRLAEAGAAIVAVDICGQIDTVPYPMGTKADLDLTVELVTAAGGAILPVQADVRDSDALLAAVRTEAGVDLAPPGTPVTDPVPPNDLAPGMVARFTSRDPVPYMGNKHVWLDGQLQPQSALNGVGGFLGWSNPMAAKAAPAAPAAPAGQQGA